MSKVLPERQGRAACSDYFKNPEQWVQWMRQHSPRRHYLYSLIIGKRTSRVAVREACDMAMAERDLEAAIFEIEHGRAFQFEAASQSRSFDLSVHAVTD